MKVDLKKNSIFWSRLGFENDPPRFDDDGTLIEFGGDYDKFASYHAAMQKTGIKLHTCILFNGWVGEDQYDYTLTDRTLDKLFEAVPDALFIPRVKLNAPIEWQKNHPEELLVFEGGNNDPEYIRPRVGTLEHDILGYDAPEGYYMGKNKRPNVGGMFSNQSFASEVWKKDAAKALVKLMEHIEAKPYGKQVIGYHIAYGTSGETCMWGRFGKTHYGDFSRIFQNAFVQWGKKKYGSEEKMLKVWGNTEIPLTAERRLVYDNVDAFLRKRPQDSKVMDLERFTSDLNAATAEFFCKTVKDRNPELITSVFYGYILECENSAYTGWLNIDQLLNSPYIDFLAAPTSYTRRAAGESGGFIVPAKSVGLKKIWVDELDIRTYLSAEAAWRIPQECTAAVLYREMAKNLSADAGFWWMDLGGGWYDSDYVREIITNVEQKAAEVRERPHKSIADILIVVDEQSFFRHTETSHLFNAQKNFQREITLSGCISEIYRMCDLDKIDLSQYKLIIFCDCPEIPEKYKNLDVCKLFTYLDDVPGLTLKPTGTTFPPGMIEYKNGFTGTVELPSCPLPAVTPSGTDFQIHATLPDGSPAMIQWGKNYYSVLPCLQWQQVRTLAERCGCKTYAEAPVTVYGDNRFIATFSKNEPEKFTFELK